MPRLLKKNKPAEIMPMYVTNLMKIIPIEVPFVSEKWPQYKDEMGNYWTTPEPVWYFDLRFVSSGRKYEHSFFQARTKAEAKRKIKQLWGVTRFDP